MDSSTFSLDRSISSNRSIWLIFIITMFYGNACTKRKQCRPWSDAAFCGVWSGSTLLPMSHLWDAIGINGLTANGKRYFQDTCGQWRPRPTCIFVQSCKGSHSPFTESFDAEYYINKPKVSSNRIDLQTDLISRCSTYYRHHTFAHGATHLFQIFIKHSKIKF